MTQQQRREPADAGCGDDAARPIEVLAPGDTPVFRELTVADAGPLEVTG